VKQAQWERILNEDACAPFDLAALAGHVEQDLLDAVQAGRTHVAYLARVTHFDRVAWCNCLKGRIPAEQTDYAMRQFKEPLNNRRNRVKVGVVVYAWVGRVTEEIRTNITNNAPAVLFLMNELHNKFSQVELITGVVDFRVVSSTDLANPIAYNTGVVRGLYAIAGTADVRVSGGAFDRQSFPKPDEALQLFNMCDRRGNMFLLSDDAKIDFFYDHLATSGLYADHFGELAALRAEHARRLLPPGDPGVNVERPCEGCSMLFCRCWARRPGWNTPHEVFTLTEEKVRARNQLANAAAGRFCPLYCAIVMSVCLLLQFAFSLRLGPSTR
jgi:hypothetical protein